MDVEQLDESAAVSLLQLPDPCLLVVLRCCDTRSICSAARAHSRLHQAAIAALTSIELDTSAKGGDRFLQLHSLVDLYLIRRGQYVDSFSLSAGHNRALAALPTTLTKLTSLTFQVVNLQLLGGCGERGVLGAPVAPPLKQLRLNECHFQYYEEKDLTEVLARLPGLEHLSLTGNGKLSRCMRRLEIRGDVLQQLPQLMYLELSGVWLEGGDDDEEVGWFGDDSEDDSDSADDELYGLGLQHITALTRLADLRLLLPGCSVTASMLSSAQHLTRLQLRTGRCDGFCFEPGVLAGKTLLQHLELQRCRMAGRAAGVVQLLSELPKLQQLTALVLSCSHLEAPDAAAAAYSALTASSKLQRLDVNGSSFLKGVFQQMFPVDRQLPHLRELDFSGVCRLTAAVGTRLVSSCPGLQSLNVRGVACSSEWWEALLGLNKLSSLSVQPPPGSKDGWIRAVGCVCGLTGLRRLELWEPYESSMGLPLPLTELQQLTHLYFSGGSTAAMRQQPVFLQDKNVPFWDTYGICFCCAAPGDTHVWRQILQHLGEEVE